MVQMFMRDLKKLSALWSVRFRVSALERFCYKGFLRNSSGTNFSVQPPGTGGRLSVHKTFRRRSMTIYRRLSTYVLCRWSQILSFNYFYLFC